MGQKRNMSRTQGDALRCHGCGQALEHGEGYEYRDRDLCVDCAMELGMSPVRKAPLAIPSRYQDRLPSPSR